MYRIEALQRGLWFRFSFSLLLVNEGEKEDEEWGLVYIDGKRGINPGR